ncbi:MAG TPA: outer membrane protein transport protein [Bacteroidota bacterium]|nr:outer membrane protein transport protein [Bacteroidota bacterium]
MTRVRLLGGALFLMLTMASLALSGGFQLNEHGAHAMSLGGAFAAQASDASAIYFNPAGLGFQTNGSVYLGATGIVPKNAFFGPIEDNTNAESDMRTQLFTPINAYVTVPLMERWHVGVGVYNPFGLGTEWPGNWVGNNLSTKVDLRTFFYTPTVAYRLTDELALAVGISYVTGSVFLKKAAEFDTQVSLNMTATSWGYDGGLIYRPSAAPGLSVGLSYRSKVKLNSTGTATFAPDISVLPQGNVSASITLPATGYAAVAYKFSDAFTGELDYQYVGWSSYQQLAFTFSANGATVITPKNYKDTYLIRAGGEYALGGLKLRAGAYYDHTPVDDAYVDPLLPDANRVGFSAGFGINLTKNLSLDAGYLFIKFFDRTVTNTIPQTSFDGTYKSYANLFSLDAGFTF